MNSRPGGPRTAVREAVRTLSPGYFALVMATGIVSIGLHEHGWDVLSATLLWTGVGGYVVLVALNWWRIAAFRAEVRGDLADPRKAFGFFTFVAGTNVLGTRLLGDGEFGTAAVLLVIGGLSWLVLGHLVPFMVALSPDHRPALASANGTWFIWVVASQSVAVLASALESASGTGRRELALLAFCSWSIGVVLYAVVGILVTARLLRYPLSPADFTPPYWVAMGATAITVVAGSQIAQMADAPVIDASRELVVGISVGFWGFGTWLIPVLLAAGWWRHVTHRIPFRYDAALWSIVFPLGMYGVAGMDLGDAGGLPIIGAVGRYESWPAVAAWTAVFAFMLVHLWRTLLRDPAARLAAAEAPLRR